MGLGRWWKRWHIALVLVIALMSLTAARRAAPDRYEPDDDATQARAAAWGETQERTLDPADNPDWVRLPVVAGGRYALFTTGLESGVNTTLRATLGEQVWHNDDTPGGNGASRLDLVAPVGGDLLVVVAGHAGGAAGRYTLSFSREGTPATPTALPLPDCPRLADLAAPGAPLTLGAAGCGQADGEGDSDFYHVEVEPDLYEIRLEGAIGTALAVREPGGQVWRGVQEAAVGVLRFVVLERGSLLVDLTRLGAPGTPYRLVLLPYRPASDALEPDLLPVTVPIGTHQRSFDPVGDLDQMRVTVVGGTTYRLRAMAQTGVPPRLILTWEGRRYEAPRSGTSGESGMDWTAPGSGELGLTIENLDGTWGQSYTLEIGPLTLPTPLPTPTLAPTPTPTPQADPFEVDAFARPPLYMGPVARTIADDQDADFLSWEAKAGLVYTIRATAVEGLDLKLTLYRYDGAQWVVEQVVDDGPGGVNPSLQFALPSTRQVIVEVRAATRGLVGDSARYQVEVQSTPLPTPTPTLVVVPPTTTTAPPDSAPAVTSVTAPPPSPIAAPSSAETGSQGGYRVAVCVDHNSDGLCGPGEEARDVPIQVVRVGQLVAQGMTGPDGQWHFRAQAGDQLVVPLLGRAGTLALDDPHDYLVVVPALNLPVELP